MVRTESMVIVGGGLAGAKAAETLREEGFDGRIMLVGEEPHLPYERPPLSKSYLLGKTTFGQAQVHPRAFFDDHDIELISADPAVKLERASQVVQLKSGTRLPYDSLLLATGCEPRHPPIMGTELDGVQVLRSIDDAELLRDRLEHGPGRLVVIGAGWIGCEVAAAAREYEWAVTLLELDSVPLKRVLGADVGAIFRDLHTAHGVEVIDHAEVTHIEGNGVVERVHTNSGRPIECDLVLVGAGVSPRVGLAKLAGLEVDNGVLVDEFLETSVPGVYAAGDIANQWHPFYGRNIRVEHWANALKQGPVAAKNMLGQHVAYEDLPYFFTDQYDVGMEYVGYATQWDEIVFRGDPERFEFICFWVKNRRVLAAMAVNVWDVVEQFKLIIRSGAQVDLDQLANPEVPLEELPTEALL